MTQSSVHNCIHSTKFLDDAARRRYCARKRRLLDLLEKTTNNDERQSATIAPSEPLKYVFKKKTYPNWNDAVIIVSVYSFATDLRRLRFLFPPIWCERTVKFISRRHRLHSIIRVALSYLRPKRKIPMPTKANRESWICRIFPIWIITITISRDLCTLPHLTWLPQRTRRTISCRPLSPERWMSPSQQD